MYIYVQVADIIPFYEGHSLSVITHSSAIHVTS